MKLQFDYKLLAALDAVIAEQSFEKAADKLAITQSAISQRIKQLEQQVAQPVIIRTSPPVATSIGEKLLKHYKQVSLLAQELVQEILPNDQQEALSISIAINADTLASWFIPAITPLLKQEAIVLDLHIANEADTQSLLTKGKVFAAISNQAKSVAGCKVEHLGQLNYLLCASPEFTQRYFQDGLTQNALCKAPAVTFDASDNMHHQYLNEQFGMSKGQYPCHRVGSSEAFVHFTLSGLAYSLLPITQAKPYLASGELISLAPKKQLVQQLYWHSWVLERGSYKRVTEHVVDYAKQILIASSH
ncbi:LysR family transcriptional regulator ArgP [Thalassotalea euphylliae]|uniref:LysR family transcriptional regulator ArgP n=1 Tax=Thalassotalea euphylliae TaxID=1655234 RepID=A0A3E0U009_9GAMM|nr:LysR family transcriptional regulator ArgP [Thalassotalea euphylliae]REL30054.1 LysR family transcriptional regulator ArgP [Thalassotalea euphylliae]